MNPISKTLYICSYCGKQYSLLCDAKRCCQCACGKVTYHRNFCKSCWDKEQDRLEQVRYEKARKVSLDEYAREYAEKYGENYCLTRGDEYYSEVDLDEYIYEGREPNWMFGTRLVRVSDVLTDEIIESMIYDWFKDFAPEDVYPQDVTVDITELYNFLDTWINKQTACYYESDYTTVVIFPEAEPEEDWQ